MPSHQIFQPKYGCETAGPDMQYFLAQEGSRSGDYGQMSRVGEDNEHVDVLSSYYTSALESGGAHQQ